MYKTVEITCFTKVVYVLDFPVRWLFFCSPNEPQICWLNPFQHLHCASLNFDNATSLPREGFCINDTPIVWILNNIFSTSYHLPISRLLWTVPGYVIPGSDGYWVRCFYRLPNSNRMKQGDKGMRPNIPIGCTTAYFKSLVGSKIANMTFGTWKIQIHYFAPHFRQRNVSWFRKGVMNIWIFILHMKMMKHAWNKTWHPRKNTVGRKRVFNILFNQM